jgi:pyruvate-formate lyase
MIKSPRIKEEIALNLNNNYRMEFEFVDTYKRHADSHPAIREAACLETMIDIWRPIEPGDLFAGRTKPGILGFGLEERTGGSGGYGFNNQSLHEFNSSKAGLDEDLARRMEETINYWKNESTENKVYQALPKDIKIHTNNSIAGGFSRVAGVYMNYDKLMQIGLPGLIAEVENGMSVAKANGGDCLFFEGMLRALSHFKNICLRYAEQAKELELSEMAQILINITEKSPQNMREGLQLAWLYSLVAGVTNYGRMDVYIGDFYVKDIDAGTITEEDALTMLKSLWKLIADRRVEANGRVMIGGKGRRNEPNADRFAILAMESSRQVIETEPQLTLRFYDGMAPALMKKALDVIGEGRVYPILYNDDVNVPAVMKAFEVSEEDAEQYMPLGCGEYMIDAKSLTSPNCSLNVMKILEVTLRNGKNGQNGKPLGLQTGEPESFETFDDLWNAYSKQVEHYADALAKRHVIEYEIEAKECAYLYVSALVGECIEKGKSIVNGGTIYSGGSLESFGLVTCGDSLAAVKKLVYNEKVFTLPELVKMMDADFEGYERERQMLLAVPKYGNDDDETDGMVAKASYQMCTAVINAGKRAGLHHYLAVNINNSGHVGYGYGTGASPDGRKNRAPLANGNTPTAGMDKNGITAFLNSIVKVDPTVHAGYVHNMKFSRRMFNEERPMLEVLLNTYFKNGGQQAMLTVLDRNDLENAMREPEKYGNLIVRVGGFSARFVQLEKDLQIDILNRTMY